ncbi:Lrp/AsnC family transcriptional regulator [Robiginitalea sp. IMCC43444]|uniref:Lrp/AsnC family transcriptional regulator n=1 Tax=Robiginitalea sp. IMCC43444 TaxID=3459121 RepID=UPI004042C10D
MKLDATDQKLLRSLQQNSKQTTKALALDLNLSNTAVYERIRRLEKQGFIRKYVALLDPAKVSRDFKVFCHVKLNQHIKPRLLQFEKEILDLKEVISCYHIGGEYDYILEIHVENMQQYREFMVTKLTAINHIGSTQSSFVINEVKHTTEIPL